MTGVQNSLDLKRRQSVFLRVTHLDRLAVISEMGWLTQRQLSRHRRRCAWCNPAGNPPPLAGKFAAGPKAARIRRRPR